ncbi:hypothetical protein SAMN04488134_101733 [Amphibacillus marinus]|uniref:Uncharacterized protein n=1 Tax=Amphibacillus marinus TaxID=872970 RepID=A0A1H8IW15_9BACI|nr:hypothetical protein SAMN04488134_101733 [Amphibacillus marinus]
MVTMMLTCFLNSICVGVNVGLITVFHINASAVCVNEETITALQINAYVRKINELATSD